MIYDVLGLIMRIHWNSLPISKHIGKRLFQQQAVEGNPEALRQYLPDSGVYRTAALMFKE